jgi:hypothetical protein
MRTIGDNIAIVADNGLGRKITCQFMDLAKIAVCNSP